MSRPMGKARAKILFLFSVRSGETTGGTGPQALPVDRHCRRDGSDDCPGAAALGDHRQAAGGPGAHAATKVGHLTALLGKERGGTCRSGAGAAYRDDRPAHGQLTLPLAQLSQGNVPRVFGVAGLPLRRLTDIDQDGAGFDTTLLASRGLICP